MSPKIHYTCNLQPNDIKAQISNVPVHFKTTVEVVRGLNGMTLKRAYDYLKNVIGHKECVPFRRFKSGIGRCAQAKQFKTVIGRWPEKPAKVLLDLLKNAESNCDAKGMDPDKYKIGFIQVLKAQIRHRSNHRAHGRINAHNRHMSHIQVVLIEQ